MARLVRFRWRFAGRLLLSWFSAGLSGARTRCATRIEATGENLGHESYPTRCQVTFDFPAKGDRGPVKVYFYSGDKNFPPEHVTQGAVDSTGCLIVGSQGTLSAGLWNTDCNIRLRGDKQFRGADHPEVAKVPKTQPRIDTEVLKWDPRRTAQGQRPHWSSVNNSHMFEWVLACAGDAKSYSPFEIGARITEVGMLGVLASACNSPSCGTRHNVKRWALPKPMLSSIRSRPRIGTCRVSYRHEHHADYRRAQPPGAPRHASVVAAGEVRHAENQSAAGARQQSGVHSPAQEERRAAAKQPPRTFGNSFLELPLLFHGRSFFTVNVRAAAA